MITSLELISKTWDSQVYKYYEIIFLGSKNGKVQYGRSQKSEKNKKNKRSKDYRKNDRGEGDHCRNKINPVIEFEGKCLSSYKLPVLSKTNSFKIIDWFVQQILDVCKANAIVLKIIMM